MSQSLEVLPRAYEAVFRRTAERTFNCARSTRCSTKDRRNQNITFLKGFSLQQLTRHLQFQMYRLQRCSFFVLFVFPWSVASDLDDFYFSSDYAVYFGHLEDHVHARSRRQASAEKSFIEATSPSNTATTCKATIHAPPGMSESNVKVGDICMISNSMYDFEYIVFRNPNHT